MSFLYTFSLFLLSIQHAFALQFEWGGAGDGNFTYDGDASVYGPHEVTLTIGVADAVFHPSAGRMRYAHPVPLCSTASNTPTTTQASFNTSFTFVMSLAISDVPAYQGDGLAFFISPATPGALPTALSTTKGLFGGLFGNSSSPQSGQPVIFAVEFDSSQESWDPDADHVGVDVGSVVSLRTASLNRSGVVLNSGKSITARIQYDGTQNKLDVYMAYTDDAAGPHLVLSAASIGLCSLLKGGSAIIGFSSASRGSVETHDLEAWTWQSSSL